MSGDASSLPPFVPYLKKNKGFSLNIMLHVADGYTGILCYPRLAWIEAWIQIVGWWWRKMISIIWLYTVYEFWIVSGEN